MSGEPVDVAKRQQLGEFRSRFHPDYVAFFDAHLAGRPMSNHTTIENFRKNPEAFATKGCPSSSQPLEKEYTLSCAASSPPGQVSMRIYEPDTSDKAKPRPLYFHIHGGGFVAGAPGMDAPLLRTMVRELGVVVADVDYRLAPEFAVGTQVSDVWDMFIFLLREKTDELNLDLSRVLVGGVSAGANLAAVTALRAVAAKIPLIFQILIVPVTTADIFKPDGSYKFASWTELAGNPVLGADRMCWFFDQYLGPVGSPKREDLKQHWEISPLLAPSLEGLPPAFVATAEVDVLKDEGKAYADRLKEAGVPVDYEEYKAVGHTFALYDGLLAESKRMVDDVVNKVKTVLAKAEAWT